jgi:hypothetical protein
MIKVGGIVISGGRPLFVLYFKPGLYTAAYNS